ncbi:MAG: hypothetical protein Q8R31_05540, partial [Candidatus Omnitrophota bacterium]|nr:hypothetical protein [Candidatus Omnitrophota bacterium]
MLKKIRKAQITTIFVFITAVLFLFALISINLSRIAQKKTAISNIADSVGLRLASQLGSMANALKTENKIYGASQESCVINKELVEGGLLMLGGAFVVPFNPLAGGVLIAGGIGFLFSAAKQSFTASKLGEQEEARLRFKAMSAYQQSVEMPINGVLFALVDDPALVKDKFDLDRDKDTEDYIPRFSKWYISRLNAFEQLGNLVKDFHKNFFHSASDNPGIYRFNFKEDEATKMVMKRGKGEDPERPPDSRGWWVDWWVDENNDGDRELKLVPWFNIELKGMLDKMRGYGYGINAMMDEKGKITIDDTGTRQYESEEGQIISRWIGELEQLQNLARDLHDIDFDTLVQGVDMWVPLLKNEKNEDWYTRLTNLDNLAWGLREKLRDRRGDIGRCVATCGQRSYSCCGGNGPCCKWGTCEGEGCEPPCIQTMGCCGVWVGCGQLCNDRHCRPTNMCNTPLGGSRYCCDITNLEPYNNPAKGCYDNIIDVYPNTGGIRHNAETVLNKLIDDLLQLRTRISSFSQTVKEINQKTYDNMHEAFYIWSDYVGGATSQKQEVGHIVYAKVEGLDPSQGFALPRPNQRETIEWEKMPIFIPGAPAPVTISVPVPKTCVSVLNATGEFTLTVARWDEDTSKTGPLSKFWRFRFSKPGVPEDYVKIVHEEAKRFREGI